MTSLSLQQVAREVSALMFLPAEGAVTVTKIIQEHKSSSSQQPSEIEISTDGNDGHHGTRGKLFLGEIVVGGNGQHGEDALDMIIGIETCSTSKCYSINHYQSAAETITCHQFELNPQQVCHVALSVMGGNGGCGGNGVDGTDGVNGKKGIDAIDLAMKGHRTPIKQVANGLNGGDGGDGGDGGNGGNGGNAGRNGDIRIYVKSEDIDLLTLFARMKNNTAAIAGIAGRGGKAGKGGKGGKGGAEHLDSEGMECYAGGVNGRNGRDGKPGLSGVDGMKGCVGTVSYWIFTPSERFGSIASQLVEAKSMYQMHLVNAVLIGMISNIFEPHLSLQLLQLQVCNDGDMQSPMNLEFDVDDLNSMVSNRPQATALINPHETGIITNEPLTWNILEQPFIGFNNSLCIDATLQIRAIASRTAAVLPRFHDDGFRYRIEYPVELSNISASSTLPMEGVLPFAIKLHNKSCLPIGGCVPGPYKRAVVVVVELLLPSYGNNAIIPVQLTLCMQHAVRMPCQPVPQIYDRPDQVRYFKRYRYSGKRNQAFMDPTMATFLLYDQPISFEIDQLAANSDWTLGGYLSILEPFDSELLFSSFAISISLFLQDLNPSDTAPKRLIQREVQTIQITSLCARQSLSISLWGSQLIRNKVSTYARSGSILPLNNQKHVIVLVINSAISKQEIHYWKALIELLGGCYDVMIWNISLYDGISYSMPEYNFCDIAKDSLIIFLNTPFQRSSYLDEPTIPLSLLPPYHIFEAARKYGVRTYVVNTIGNKSSPMFAMGDIMRRSREVKRVSTDLGLPLSPTEIVNHVQRNVPYKYNEHLTFNASDNITKSHACLLLRFIIDEPPYKVIHGIVDKLISKIVALRPDHKYHVFKRLHEQPIIEVNGCSCSKVEFDLGIIEFRRGLDRTYATVACKTRYIADLETKGVFMIDATKPESNDVMVDLFVIVKLLPFQRKLLILDQIPNNSHNISDPRMSESNIGMIRKAVLQAILSDLVDEQFVFFHATTKPVIEITDVLVMLKLLAAFPFEHAKHTTSTSGGLVHEVIAPMAAMVECYPKQYGLFNHYLVQPTHNLLSKCLRNLTRTQTTFSRRSIYRECWKPLWKSHNVTSSNKSAILQEWMKRYRDPYQVINSGKLWTNNCSAAANDTSISPIPTNDIDMFKFDDSLSEYFQPGDNLIGNINKRARMCRLRHAPNKEINGLHSLLSYSAASNVITDYDDNVQIIISGSSLDPL